ncbi:nicotinate-nucleotide adenylyltransferase [Proteobacteria bacterium 005FR1]|nr:nicotinate-nucleotide adenylyltransferase [Proteobacteria bacterium 005FR1]
MSRRPLIGLFGGTFDPVHIGHLRMALELRQQLEMDEMRLVPCHIPPHRREPAASADHRAAMVELAIAACPDLSIDRVELANPEPSYSLHTLQALRRSLGPEPALCLAMGMDSLVSLNSWHRWDELLDYAHIVVAARPGWQEPSDGELADYVTRHRGKAADLRQSPGGHIVIEELMLLPVSSTAIRAQIAQGRSPQFLLPDNVWAYILRNNLYRR